MKKLFKKSAITGGIVTLGLAVGFAASTALQDLDAIKHNFDYIVGLNQSNEDTIGNLNTTIADLEAEIVQLEQNQNNSGKQERIEELEAQVEVLIAERDNLLAENSDLETRINDLRIYTDMYVEVAE